MNNILKKNQIIIYTFALMLVAAGYLNYTSNIKKESVETSVQVVTEEDAEGEDISIDNEVADIGDATLVNSNDVITDESNKSALVGNEEINADKAKETFETSATTNNNDDYFVKSKLERETMYSQMLETYEKILNSSNSNEAQKQTATQEITKINEKKNSIMICENLIKTKGFENSVVFVNDQSVSVIIGAETLKQEEIAQIQNIISRELNSEIENIHISTK